MNQRPGHAIDVHARADLDEDHAPLAADTPFHILILGDFAGPAAADTRSPLSARAPQQVDRDDLDAVMNGIAPVIDVRSGATGQRSRLVCRSLADLHPDSLCESMPHLRALVDLRKRLANPSTFRRALEELKPSEGSEKTAATRNDADESKPVPPPTGASLLDAIVAGSAPVDVSPTVGDELDIGAFVKEVVRPHLVESDPRQPAVLAEMDRAIAEALRAVLHDPAFQDVERVWRATWFLVRRVETSPVLKVFIFDISRDEIINDAAGQDALRRVMIDERAGTPGAVPWSLIVADFSCRADPEDVAAVHRLAKLAQGAGAPVVAAADPSLVTNSDWPADPHPVPWSPDRIPVWTAARNASAGSWLALTFPGFLLRMPYGADDDPCETVLFEEATDQGLRHGQYLWGRAGFALAILLAQQFAASGTSPRLSANLQLNGLPLYLRRTGGQGTVQPCAEVLTSERWASDMLDHGVVPVMSVKDEDAVRFARIQSVSLPPTRLAGRWT